MKVLILDDQRSARHILKVLLSKLVYVELVEADSLESARNLLKREQIDVALIDVRLSSDIRNTDGLTLLKEISQEGKTTGIVVTAFSELNYIRTAMRNGAYDYILKDELCEELVIPVIESIKKQQNLENEVIQLRAQDHNREFPLGIVGNSPSINKLRSAIQKIAISDRPVLVTGSTGTGKELVVQAIHRLGNSPAEPLFDINCGSIPEQLMESELFGHLKGSFTDAKSDKDGYLRAVGKGTLFLDEIAEMPYMLQSKLLRVLESRTFRMIGATAEVSFNGRIVAATHADLEERVKEEKFRSDLYYRLNVLSIRVPDLEERLEDIPILVSHFLKDQPRKIQFTPDALEYLITKKWPGNVRELRNLIDRVVVFAESETADKADIAAIDGQELESSSVTDELRLLAKKIISTGVENKLKSIEDALIEEAMFLSEDNKSAAARLLGIHRKSVERKVETHIA